MGKFVSIRLIPAPLAGSAAYAAVPPSQAIESLKKDLRLHKAGAAEVLVFLIQPYEQREKDLECNESTNIYLVNELLPWSSRTTLYSPGCSCIEPTLAALAIVT
jgi:hypothetical protein